MSKIRLSTFTFMLLNVGIVVSELMSLVQFVFTFIRSPGLFTLLNISESSLKRLLGVALNRSYFIAVESKRKPQIPIDFLKIVEESF